MQNNLECKEHVSFSYSNILALSQRVFIRLLCIYLRQKQCCPPQIMPLVFYNFGVQKVMKRQSWKIAINQLILVPFYKQIHINSVFHQQNKSELLGFRVFVLLYTYRT